MNVKVPAIEKVIRKTEVEIDPLEFLESMKKSLCNVPFNAYVKNGRVITCRSFPCVSSLPKKESVKEYKFYDVSSQDFEIIKKINELELLIRSKFEITKPDWILEFEGI